MTVTIQVAISLTALYVALLILILVRKRGRSDRQALVSEISRTIEKARTEGGLIPTTAYRVVSIRPPVLGNIWTATLAFGSETLVRMKFTRSQKHEFEFREMDISERRG